MTLQEIELIGGTVDLDYIIDNPESVYEIQTKMINELIKDKNTIQLLTEQIKPYHDIMIKLNKENKKLYNKLSKYEK